MRVLDGGGDAHIRADTLIHLSHSLLLFLSSVILFEFMFRVAPFVGKDEKHLKAHILKGKYKIPEDKRSGFSKQCIDFLENV